MHSFLQSPVRAARRQTDRQRGKRDMTKTSLTGVTLTFVRTQSVQLAYLPIVPEQVREVTDTMRDSTRRSDKQNDS